MRRGGANMSPASAWQLDAFQPFDLISALIVIKKRLRKTRRANFRAENPQARKLTLIKINLIQFWSPISLQLRTRLWIWDATLILHKLTSTKTKIMHARI